MSAFGGKADVFATFGNDPKDPYATSARSSQRKIMKKRRSRSVWPDIGRPDHLGPFLGFVRDELSEVSGRERKRRAGQFGEPRLQLGIGKARIDLFVEFIDDVG